MWVGGLLFETILILEVSSGRFFVVAVLRIVVFVTRLSLFDSNKLLSSFLGLGVGSGLGLGLG